MSTQYFLARKQKVFGPLSPKEIQSLRESGQLSAYTWIWCEGEENWNPIDPPPALPALENQQPRARPNLELVPEPPLYEPPVAEQAPRKRAHLVAQETFRVILFDHANAISGWLVSATESGCELRSEHLGSDPHFVQKGRAHLTVHDTHTGETIKLPVRVSAIGRADGSWSYRVRWNTVPALLNRSERSAAA